MVRLDLIFKLQVSLKLLPQSLKKKFFPFVSNFIQKNGTGTYIRRSHKLRLKKYPLFILHRNLV